MRYQKRSMMQSLNIVDNIISKEKGTRKYLEKFVFIYSWYSLFKNEDNFWLQIKFVERNFATTLSCELNWKKWIVKIYLLILYQKIL